MVNLEFQPEFNEHLVGHARENPENSQLPLLNVLSNELGVSIARLREQMEVAKALGLVEVCPRTGIKRLSYTFLNPVW